MARADGCRVQVWCEDRRQEQFVRSLLDRIGFDRRRVYFSTAPRGAGAASQWVIARYSGEVSTKVRATRNQANLGFLVIVDGDDQGLDGRKQSLCGEPDGRKAADRIAIWVPTWSVETWILWLCGDSSVREDMSFKNKIRGDQEYKRLVQQSVEGWDPSRPDERDSIPSLAAARDELTRLPGVR